MKFFTGSLFGMVCMALVVGVIYQASTKETNSSEAWNESEQDKDLYALILQRRKRTEIGVQRYRTCAEERIGGGYRNGEFVYLKEWEAKQ